MRAQCEASQQTAGKSHANGEEGSFVGHVLVTGLIEAVHCKRPRYEESYEESRA